MIFAQPELDKVLFGLIRCLMPYIAIGIIGATVMPHNLYLHSLGTNQKIERTTAEQAFEIQLHRFYHCIKLSF
jgi:Mn2+/Fe2+ NRAMP family transporter